MDQKPVDGVSSQLDENLQREIDEALGGKSVEQLMSEVDPPGGAGGDPGSGGGGADAAPGGQGGDGRQSGGERGADEGIAHEVKRGRIVAVRGEDVFVEFAGIGKTQGVAPMSQFDRPPRVGAIMDFVVTRFEESEGLFILSREGAVERATWDAMARGAVVEARCTGSNKGGLELELIGGIKAFMPASQVDIGHIDDLDTMIGEKVKAVVTEVDRKGKRVVISRRQYQERTRAAARDKTLAELEVGQLRDGVVTSVTDFGAFVDLGGVDGLIHVSDMSYSHVDKPADVVKVGEKVRVKVLKIDEDKNRIGLGLKQIEPDPWESFCAQTHAGDQVSGKVTRTAPFGAFVEVTAGVEGLAPISELSWRRIGKTEDVLQVGDSKLFTVMEIQPGKRRLSLSLRQAKGDPWVGAEHKYAVGNDVEGTVQSIKEFGAFVELELGVEGLVHISELDHKRINRVEDVVKAGDKKTFRVLSVDEEGRRISLSLKAMTEGPQDAERRQAADYSRSAPAKPKPRRKDLKGGMGSSGALGSGLGDLKL